MRTDAGLDAEIQYLPHGAALSLSGKLLCRIEGGVVRLVTGKPGSPWALLGIEAAPQEIVLHPPSGRPREFVIRPNQRIPLEPDKFGLK